MIDDRGEGTGEERVSERPVAAQDEQHDDAGRRRDDHRDLHDADQGAGDGPGEPAQERDEVALEPGDRVLDHDGEQQGSTAIAVSL